MYAIRSRPLLIAACFISLSALLVSNSTFADGHSPGEDQSQFATTDYANCRARAVQSESEQPLPLALFVDNLATSTRIDYSAAYGQTLEELRVGSSYMFWVGRYPDGALLYDLFPNAEIEVLSFAKPHALGFSPGERVDREKGAQPKPQRVLVSNWAEVCMRVLIQPRDAVRSEHELFLWVPKLQFRWALF